MQNIENDEIDISRFDEIFRPKIKNEEEMVGMMMMNGGRIYFIKK